MIKRIVSAVTAVAAALTLTACGGGEKEMVIGITYFEPMNYFNDANELVGFETEFSKAVCEILKVTPKFQEINWITKETELNANSIDCIWNGMTITSERAENMSISRAYMKNMQVIITKKDNVAGIAASVEGKKIVAEKESAGESVALSSGFFEGSEYTAVDTQAKALMEVASGTADACVVDYVISIGMIGEGTDFADLAVVEEQRFEEEEYGIAFRKGDTELTEQVNDAIKTLIDNGKLMEIAKKYKLQDLLITN